MKGIQKKLSQQKDGISSFTALLMLIIIIALVYQFIAPILGYPSFTDYYKEYQENKAESINYSFDLIDTVTKQRIVPTSTKNFNSDDSNNDYDGAILYYVLDKTDSYSIKLTANLPYSITSPYTVKYITTEVRQFQDTSLDWGMEFESESNVIYETTGKFSSDEYIYNMGSEIRLNDGILYIYGNIYEVIVFSPNNEILYYFDFLIRMDD